jgi:hypothetical protein
MRKVRMPRSGWGRFLTVVCVGAVIAGITGVVQAAIPDGSGVIHGCYAAGAAKKSNGTPLNIVDSDAASCAKDKTEVTWSQIGPQGPAGKDGANGRTILNGSGVPGSSTGVDGDFYLDTSAELLYGPKSGGAWPATGTSLIGAKGDTGATGPPGPSNLAALQGSACTVNGHDSTLQVSTDDTTGAVSLTCAPQHKVSVTMSGVSDPRIFIDDNGSTQPCDPNACSMLVQTGDQVSVSLSSGGLSGGGTPFSYSCNGGPTQTATSLPLPPPASGFVYVGTCPATGFATITADYTVTATGT